MKKDIKRQSNSKVEIDFELTPGELEVFVQKAIQKFGKDLKVEGFRTGKAPREMIEQKVGKQNLIVEAADMAIREAYLAAVKELKLEPIAQPEIDILKLAPANPFVFRAKFSVLPPVELPDYRKIAAQVKQVIPTVSEEETRETLQWIQRSRGKFTVKAQPAQKGDFVEIEYWSKDVDLASETKGVSQEGEKGKNQQDAFILGEGHFLPGFEDALFGMEAGKEKQEILLNIPLDHKSKNLAGKQVRVNVKMKSVQTVDLPRLDDQFAKSLGKFENVEALRKNVREGLLMEKQEGERQRIRAELVKKISEASKVELPELLITSEQDRLLERFKNEVDQKLHIVFDAYLAQVKKTEKDIRGALRQEATARVKNYLVLRAIGEREGLEVSHEEVVREANNLLRHYESAEKAKQALDPEQLQAYTKEVLKDEKVFQLLEKLTISETTLH